MSADTEEYSGFPMFYRAPRALHREKDAGKRIRRNSFGFARNSNAIPLMIGEFPMAAAYYPIVFSSGSTPAPAALVGLEDGCNFFVNEDGNWSDGAYVPAYVIRYPFILMDDLDNKQYVLCIDSEADLLNEQDGEMLFEDGNPSQFVTEVMKFCAKCHEIGDETDAFVRALQQYGLLTEAHIQLPFSSGTNVQLGGYQMISPEKFSALPDSVIGDWHRRGWLGQVYAQLLSSHRWNNLAKLYGERHDSKLVPSPPSPEQNTPIQPLNHRVSEVTGVAAPAGFRLNRRPGRGKDL